MQPLASFSLALAMFAVFALGWGGAWLVAKGGSERRRGVLMLVAAAVLLGNVLIWTV